MSPRTAVLEADSPLPAPPAFAGSDGAVLPMPLLMLEGALDDLAPSMFRREPPPYTRPRSNRDDRRVTVEVAALVDAVEARLAVDPVRAVSALVEVAVDALLRKDLRAALTAYLDAQTIAPSDRTIAGNIERLRLLLQRREDLEGAR
ncbi:MAG: hypothetical protein IPH07_33230 [Deltaproteobacteria bacterium]|nr:hypothetical protein [Deltaproteobacteria bacterium]MBK8716642.1 hypothetical protein [Deltaproteobacteria bacterium]